MLLKICPFPQAGKGFIRPQIAPSDLDVAIIGQLPSL
jgi:hypothetical protein